MKSKVINLFGDETPDQNEGQNYAQLLEQFIEPFDSDFSDTEYYEDVIELAIAAWNFGNMKMILPEGESDEAITSVVEDDVNIDLLNRMIDLKITKFKDYSDFIVDYELEESDDNPVLSVTTQQKDLYLTAMAEDLEADYSENDYEENYINRCAIIVKPLQPFIDWLDNLYPNGDHDLNGCMTYLISSDNEDVELWVKNKYDKLFTRELEGWHTNKKDWPKKRTYKMFQQWFQVEISEMVYDLENEPVLK